MPDETNTPNKDDSAVAVHFVHDQLKKARASLHRTRVIGVVLIVVVVAYISFVTHALVQYLTPPSAANMAKGVIAERITENGEELSRQLREGMPIWLAKLPDFALEQIPVARTEIESRIEKSLRDNAKATATQVEKHVDLFLDANQESIKTILAGAADIETTRHLGPELQKQMLAYFQAHDSGQESLQAKLEHALGGLEGVAARVQRLAKAADLTADEKRARRAIAVLLKNTNWNETYRAPKQAEK